MFRAEAYEVRLDVGTSGIDPKLIDDIPDDWDSVGGVYVLAALVDPDDMTQPAAQWMLLTAAGVAGGYGIYGSY